MLRIGRILGVGTAACALLALRAGAETVLFDAGITYYTPSISTNVTTGADMAGMKITAYFANGTSQNATWVGDAWTEQGGAWAVRYNLVQAGNTYNTEWTLNNMYATALTRLVIDAAPGKTAFDIKLPGNAVGTPNSSTGSTFNVIYSSQPFSITATYRDLVALEGAAPVGDLYRLLDIQFGGAGMPQDGEITFIADTDNSTGPICTDGAPAVPLPPAVWGGLILLGSIFGAKKVRSRRKA